MKLTLTVLLSVLCFGTTIFALPAPVNVREAEPEAANVDPVAFTPCHRAACGGGYIKE
jgi:hypothetical protein